MHVCFPFFALGGWRPEGSGDCSCYQYETTVPAATTCGVDNICNNYRAINSAARLRAEFKNPWLWTWLSLPKDNHKFRKKLWKATTNGLLPPPSPLANESGSSEILSDTSSSSATGFSDSDAFSWYFPILFWTNASNLVAMNVARWIHDGGSCASWATLKPKLLWERPGISL